MTADDGGEKSRFRCLDAARYTLAAGVTVLIMYVTVHAIEVVLRPESLQLSVRGGYISAVQFKPPPAAPELISIELNLRARNPSGRVRMYYLGISAYLFESTAASVSSTSPEDDCVVGFSPRDIAVVQQEAVDSVLAMRVKKTQMDPSYFDMLYSNGSRLFSGMTMRLDGDLVTEVTSEFNKTRRTTYFCEQLLFGGGGNEDDGDEAFKYRQDVICKQRQGLN